MPVITLQTAAERMPEEIRLSPSNLRAYASGRLTPVLKAEKVGKTWAVSEAEFARWLKAYQRQPRNKAASVRKGWPRRKQQ